MRKMSSAFILINTEVGAGKEILEKIRNMENIVEAYTVYGKYDIIAKVEAKSMAKLKETLSWNIRRLDKVQSTSTMIVMKR
jgi:DNA-binding Lrp family transcriptional regulator